MKSYENSYFYSLTWKIFSMQNDILYETYDRILQYVQFSACSHNFQTNNIFSLSINNGIYYIYLNITCIHLTYL